MQTRIQNNIEEVEKRLQERINRLENEVLLLRREVSAIKYQLDDSALQDKSSIGEM